MNILVDGRICSLFSAGVGTFFTSAVFEWALQSDTDTFYIILPKGLDSKYELPSIFHQASLANLLELIGVLVVDKVGVLAVPVLVAMLAMRLASPVTLWDSPIELAVHASDDVP